MSTTDVIDAVNAFQEAITTENLGEIASSLEALEATYDEVQVQEQTRIQRAEAARATGTASGDTQTDISELRNRAMGTNFARAGLLTAANVYIAAPSESEIGQLFKQTDQLLERERAYQESSTKAAQTLSEVSLPATLRILSVEVQEPVVPLKTQVTVRIVVGNVGDEPSESVNLSVRSDGISEPVDRSIGPLDASERVATEVEVTPVTTGDSLVKALLQSDSEEVHRDSIELRVQDKCELLESAVQTIEGVHTKLQSVSGKTSRYESKVSAAEKSAKKAVEDCENGRSKQADNRANTSMNQLGALLNSLQANDQGSQDSSGSGNGNGNGGKKSSNGKGKGNKSGQNSKGNGNQTLPSALTDTVISFTEGAIDKLATAKETQLE